MKNENSLINSNSNISELNSSIEVDNNKNSSKKSYKKQL